VSGVGDDANPCSRTAPCKTFAGAISKTAAGGEINVLDPGGFGAVTITKSISIESDGAMAGVLVSGTNGIIVSSTAVNVVVVLRGLTIEGLGTGLNGIRFLGSGTLHVENCTINNFTQKGIDFEPNAPSQLFVKDTIVRNNRGANGGGVLIKPTAGQSARASLDRVRAENNLFGFRAEDNSTVSISNSITSGNSSNGIAAASLAAGPVSIVASDTVTAHNGASGVSANGSAAVVRISNVTTTNNATGLGLISSGQIVSFGNNNNAGNVSNGVPTSTIAQQ
jgi:hypothetical protein